MHSRRTVDAEELRKLGFPEDLIAEAVRNAEKGLLDFEPSPDLVEKVMKLCFPLIKEQQTEGVIKGIYQHFKGKYYLVLGIAYHSESIEPMVLYVPLYGDLRLIVRPKAMFFEEVDKPEYNYKGPRFQYVGKP